MPTQTRRAHRVAVLGATGCVGRQVCAAFAEHGHDVLAIARNNAAHVSGYPFVSLDVSAAGPEKLAEVFRSHRIDTVVNATGGWGSTETEMVYAHVRLVEQLLDALALLPDRPRLVHVGSIHEYGPVPDGALIDEGVAPHPDTPYAKTKLAGSAAILRAARRGDVDAVVLRAVNVCGPHPPPESFLGGLVRRLRRAAATGAEVELRVADARRDFVDVRDLAAAVVAAADAPAAVTGRVVNIGRGEAVAMRDLVHLLVAAAGFPPDLVPDQGADVRSKGGDWTRADIRLAAKLLGWRPRTALPDSIRDMWAASADATPGPVTVGAGDPRYAALVSRGVNGLFRGQPESIHVVGTAEQVVCVVDEAVRGGKRVVARSGGHCFEGFVDDPEVRVVVDLSELTSVYYDPARRAFAVEAGATLGRLYRTLYLGWGVTVPAGRCPGICVGGHILGGGGGALSRTHGLAVDHLYAVEVVVVDKSGRARLVVATRDPDDPNHDLWWAHTGVGGGNLGIVTKYWFRSPGAVRSSDATGDDPAALLPKPPATLLKCSVAWPWEGLTEEAFTTLVRNYGTWHARNSADGTPYAGLDSALALLRPASGVIGLEVSLDGTVPDAERRLADYLGAVGAGLGAPPPAEPTRVPWLTATLADDDEYAGLNTHFKAKAALLRRPWTDEQIATVYRYLTDGAYDNPAAVAYLLSYGGRINSVPPDATAMAHRDSVLKAYWSVAWTGSEANEKHLTWLRRFYRDVYATTGGVPVPDEANSGSFINYPDTDLADPHWNTSGVAWSTLYYRDNYPRLQRVKARWDPRDVFHHALSIKPAP